MHDSGQRVYLHKPRPPRRARPSLAALADSGYEPSRPLSLNNGSLPRSFLRNAMVSPEPQERSDPFSLGIASHLRGDDSLPKDPRMSTRSRSQTMRSFPFSFTLDGENGGGHAKSNSGSSAYPGTASLSRAGTTSRSATISSAWSGVSNRLFTESVPGGGNERQANSFTEQFDKLAKKHGIQPFPYDFKGEPTSVSVSSVSREQSSGDSTPALPGNKFWNKLLRRSPSTVDISKHHGNMKMSLSKRRNISISDLAAIGKGKRDSLKGMHLEDMIRLGGVAIFNLPLGLAPGDLLIPTCIHAAATYILNNGIKTPGLFRVSGNVNTTFALYDYYQRQLEENNNESVVATTALARLPTHIHYSTHDIAHLFKKLLHGLPGGLLGSPAVFQALYNINNFVYPDPSLDDRLTRKVRPRMIALALASINLHFRISLICAVFGLLRTISLASDQETETKVKDPHETFAALKDDALGIVFGPLLLGDKSDQILCEELEDRGGLLLLPRVERTASISRREKSGKSKAGGKIDPGYNRRQLEKTKRAAMVCQMLIDHWEDISHQLKRINALGITAQAYDLPVQAYANGFNYVQEDHVNLKQDQPLEPMGGSQRIKSNKGTTRSRRALSDTADSRPFHSLNLHGHHLGKHLPHLPHLHGHHLHKPMEDLMRFPSHSPPPEDQLGALPTIPLVPERLERKVVEMTPVPELATPRETPTGTPNWKPHDSEPVSPGKESMISEANWKLYPDQPSPGKESFMSTPNWRARDPEKTPGKESATGTPNWRICDPEKSPGKESTFSTPNWRIHEPDKTPGKESTRSTPNWRTIPHIPTPKEVQALDSPNWRVIDPEDAEEPTTPTKKTARIALDQLSMESDDTRSTHSSGMSSGPPSPSLEVQAEAAIRFRRSPPSPSVDDVIVEGDVSLSAPEELESGHPVAERRNNISPVPELPFASRDIMSEPEVDERPSTPKPRRPPPSFSIFEDDNDRTPRASRIQPQLGPALTLTRPNSQTSIHIDTRETQASPTRPPPDSPARLGGVPLQPSTPNRRRRPSIDSDFEDRYLFKDDESGSPGKKFRGNSALYAEIRRLQRLVDAKTEEANSTKKELELAKSMAQAGTMSQLLRDAQEEIKVWRNRAQWAEKQLRVQYAGGERELPLPPTPPTPPLQPLKKGRGRGYSVG